jgi:hypothetical protein
MCACRKVLPKGNDNILLIVGNTKWILDLLFSSIKFPLLNINSFINIFIRYGR